MNRISKIIMIAAFFAVPVISSAQNEMAASSPALQQASILHNPVSQGMGGVRMLSTSSIAWGSYGNIAALPFSDLKGDAQVSFNKWNPSSSNFFNGAFGYNFKQKWGISAGFSTSSGKQVELFSDEGDYAGQFSPSYLQGNIGVSWRFMPWISLGANLRMSEEKLTADYSVKGFLADVFVMCDFKGMRISAGVDNLGGKIKDAGGNAFPVATSAVIAAGYFKNFGKHGIEVEADADFFISASSVPLSVALGAAYCYNDLLSIRGGYHTGGLTGNYFSAGLGIKLFGVRLDAAYIISGNAGPIGNTITAGLGYCF